MGTKKQDLAKTATKKFGQRATVRGHNMSMMAMSYSSLADEEKTESTESAESSNSDITPTLALKTKSISKDFAYLGELKTNSNRHNIRKCVADDPDIFSALPPPLNEDGFFEYESDEELPPLPPRSAPPPPPP